VQQLPQTEHPLLIERHFDEACLPSDKMKHSTPAHRGVPIERSKAIFARLICMVVLAAACPALLWGQDATPNLPPAPAPDSDPVLKHRPSAVPAPASTTTITLTVAKGTPVQVALDEEVRIRKVGQPIHGHVVEPVYAFDRLVIPVGTKATGQITEIEPVSGGKRTLEALNADFTPPHRIQVEFS